MRQYAPVNSSAIVVVLQHLWGEVLWCSTKCLQQTILFGFQFTKVFGGNLRIYISTTLNIKCRSALMELFGEVAFASKNDKEKYLASTSCVSLLLLICLKKGCWKEANIPWWSCPTGCPLCRGQSRRSWCARPCPATSSPAAQKLNWNKILRWFLEEAEPSDLYK